MAFEDAAGALGILIGIDVQHNPRRLAPVRALAIGIEHAEVRDEVFLIVRRDVGSAGAMSATSGSIGRTGILVAPFEHDAIGPELFRAACELGLEGMVSKRKDRPYQAGRSKYWVKVKNRNDPAMSRVMQAFS
jgi:hypothetical protein